MSRTDLQRARNRGWPRALVGTGSKSGDSSFFLSQHQVWLNLQAGTQHGNHLGELGEMWNPGADNSHFYWPSGIAFDGSGNVYVCDGAGNVWTGGGGNHRVQVFDSAGNYLNTIGETGVPGSDNSHFSGPLHIAIDTSDHLYVTDTGNHRVQILDVSNPLSPTYIATIGVTGESGSDTAHLSSPAGVAVDSSYIYVADTYNHRIQLFHRSTKTYADTVGSGWGTTNSQFNTPSDVAVDAEGKIYVADCINTRVQLFNSSGVYMHTYGTTGVPYLTDNYHYSWPSGVAVGASGSIYVTEEQGRRLLKLSATGEPRWSVGEPGVGGDDNGHFQGPADVVLDRTGRVYVVDSWNNRVQVFRSDGVYHSTLGTGWGGGSYQFRNPRGATIDSGGNIYIADTRNHRVQVYSSARVYVATLGVTGVPGASSSHFNEPYDVAVDSAGTIYVVDHGNHRVQVFDHTHSYVRTIGETGVAGDDFAHLSDPTAIAVDADDRVYVADNWGTRVQVFDATSAYLTSIGGSRGSGTGDVNQSFGLAFDGTGNLYVPEYLGHRLKKFAPGVRYWTQTNINGFGDRWNELVLSLATFNGKLYAGTSNWEGGEVWRSGSEWEQVNSNGFGNSDNGAMDHLIEFDGYLYASTWNQNGGEVWRTPNGTSWSQVASGGFGDSTNGEVYRFAVFSDTLYASTWSYTDTHGTEIYTTTNGTSWTRAVSNGFGDAHNGAAVSFEVFNGYLYAGTYNTTTGCEVWRSPDGANWAQVNTDGFGDADNLAVSALAAFNGYLYASTRHDSGAGAEVWRCQTCEGTDWAQVVDNGFGNVDTAKLSALEVLDGLLFFVVGNYETGMEAWRTGNGTNWEQVGPDGLGDSNNRAPYWDNSVAVFNDELYVGSYNFANGGEVWKLWTPHYVPLAMKRF